jgi:hypothetical protein
VTTTTLAVGVLIEPSIGSMGFSVAGETLGGTNSVAVGTTSTEAGSQATNSKPANTGSSKNTQ